MSGLDGREADRFIPTGVGKIMEFASYEGLPHGSSPRVWGKWLRPLKLYSNTTVHPHGCGENGANNADNVDVYGSSPRVWGKC